MGLYKRLSENREELRRYNAAKRRAERLAGADSSRLIRLETVSETERFEMARDADRLTSFNKAVEKWADETTNKLRITSSVRSTRIPKELHSNLYTDKYGIVNRVGFSFPRHGIYIHKGAGEGYGGYIGSKWEYLKKINGVEVGTGIIRHTNITSLGKQNTGNRRAFKWFDPVIQQRIPELEKIVINYFDTMIIDATHIYIEK